MLGGREIMEMRPALLPIDKAAVLARRKLAQLISVENGSVLEIPQHIPSDGRSGT